MGGGGGGDIKKEDGLGEEKSPMGNLAKKGIAHFVQVAGS